MASRKLRARAVICGVLLSLSTQAALAADLGASCCADLEERVAELEALSARKGNRKVSLTVSGHVNEAIIFWDDGFEKNAYVVTNNTARTRFRFIGDAKITADWAAGYLLEIGARYAGSNSRNQTTPGGGSNANQIDIRHSAWWIEHQSLGRVWVGKTTGATDGVTEINLANLISAGPISSGDYWLNGFFLRNRDNSLSSRRWGNITPSFNGDWNLDGDRNTTVKYVSPTLAGFSFSTAWGEDDFWDAALRYAGEYHGVRVGAGVGYKRQLDNVGKTGSDGVLCADTAASNFSVSSVDCFNVSGSASLLHVPTGLFISGAAAQYTDRNRRALYGNVAGIKDHDSYWIVTSGIEQNWFGIGRTTFYGEYAQHRVGAGIGTAGASTCGTFTGADVQGGLGCLASANVDFWGVGMNQEVAAAAMDLYVSYRHFDPDVKTSLTGSTIGSASAQIKPFDAVMTGAIIRF